ncbi:MAG: hypothetical protein QXK12_05970 [Candidatus Nezhaarchaeales archaeon]
MGGLSRVELAVLEALAAGDALAFNFEAGWHHPSLTKLSREELKAALRKLVNMGLIAEEEVEKSILCPSCGSKKVEKDLILEHLACGALNRREGFKSSGKLVCPSCKRELRSLGSDYLIVGAWFKCSGCGKTFEMPGVSHRCVACGFNFDFKDSVYEAVKEYSLTPKGLEEVKRIRFIRAAEKAAEKAGFTPELKGRVKGLSGLEHGFDLVLRKGENTVVLDVVLGGAAGSLTASALAKLYDVSSVTPIIAVTPSAPAEVKALAARRKAVLVEAETPEELSLALEKPLTKGLKP